MANEIVETWVRLRKAMLRAPAQAVQLRPPSLRDACYSYCLATRSKNDASPEIIEAYVNGLELGASLALIAAWEEKHGPLA